MTKTPHLPLLFCFAGPTASGKSTISTAVLKEVPNLMLSISTTSRPPRNGEEDGKHYHFVSKEEFQNRVSSGQFIEHAEFSGHFYGTEKRNIADAAIKSVDVSLDIDVQGVEQLKSLYPAQVVTICVLPPSLDELKKRLEARGKDSKEQVAIRLEVAKKEVEILSNPFFSDYLLINDELPESILLGASIIRAERARIARLTSSLALKI